MLRQVTSVHSFQPYFVIDERISKNPTVVFCHDDDHTECLHELGRRIFIAAAFCAQIVFKIRNKYMGNFFQGDVLYPILDLHELLQASHTTVILGISSCAFANTDQFFHIFIVRAEQLQ